MAAVLNRTTKQYIPSANTPDYPAAQWIINPNLSAVIGFDSRYWIITGDAVTLMSQAERDVVDATLIAARKDSISNDIDATHPSYQRALAEILIDEINNLRQKHNSMRTEILAATSLANLQSRITTNFAVMPDRTLAQLKTALRNKLDG